MRGHNVNIYFSEETYNKIKPLIAQRKVSEFVNKLVERELAKEQKKEKELSDLKSSLSVNKQSLSDGEQGSTAKQKEQLKERLITAYKREAKNKDLQEELAIWDSISGDGLDDE